MVKTIIKAPKVPVDMDKFIGQLNDPQKRIKLDLVDRKILYLLGKNGRVAESSIAKSVRCSKEVVHYRLKRMEEVGFLHGFITLLDHNKLGQTVYEANLSLQSMANLGGLIKMLVDHPQVSVVKHYNSPQYLQFSLNVENTEEFATFFEDLMGEFHEYIKDYNIATLVEEYFFGLNFLLEESLELAEKKGSCFKRDFATKEPLGKLDSKDLDILQKLKLDSRIPLLRLGREVKMSPSTVKNRISSMIRRGIIKSFVPYASFSYVGYVFYTLQLRTKNLKFVRIVSFLQHEPNVVWIRRRIGKWNFKISIFARNNTEYMEILQKIRNHFSENIIALDSGVVFKQYKFNQRL